MKHSDKPRFIEYRDIFIIFILLMVIYNINFRPIASHDTIPAALLPFNILEYHNLYFNQYLGYYQDNGYNTYFLRNINGNMLSAYPIVIPILITPLYLIPYMILRCFNVPVDLYDPNFFMTLIMTEKFAASMIAALSAIFIYLSLKRLIDKKIAIIGTLVYAFATNTWAISSQALWQHGMTELLLSAIIFLVISNEYDKKDNRNLIFMGIASGLLIFNRPSDSLLLLPVIVYVLCNKYRGIISYSSAAFISGLPFAIYNIYYFGNIFGGYGEIASWFIMDSSVIARFIGLLISPSRGLLIFTPVAALSVIGLLNIKKINNNNIQYFLYIACVSIFLEVLVYSNFKIWWAGWSYGPRFLTGTLPILMILASLALPKDISKNKQGTYNKMIVLLF